MTNRETMQQALEKLKKLEDLLEESIKALNTALEALRYGKPNKAITILREALEQPEQEPSQWRDIVVVALVREGVNKHRARELADHFAAQPKQEPWRESASDYERGVIDGRQMQAQSSVDKAVNAMTQRPWVGLEIEEVQDSYNADYQAQTRAVEAKLKERNG